jgi:hypothetical protein
MNAKQTKVALRADSLGVTREFEITHAERLLTMQNNGGWYLATEDYELKDGNIVRRTTEENQRKPKGRSKK